MNEIIETINEVKEFIENLANTHLLPNKEEFWDIVNDAKVLRDKLNN